MSYPPPPNQPSYPQPTGEGFGAPPKRLRGRIPLRLGVIFLVVGLVLIVVGAVVLAKKSFGKVDGFSRVSVASGSGTANFSGTGKYLAYYENRDVSSGIDRVPLPLVTLQSPSGKSMQLDTLYGGRSRSSGTIKTRLTYDYNGHKGVAIYQFTISEKGRYQVSVQANGAASGSDIAFGKSIAGGLVVGVLLVIPGVLLFIAGVILLIIGLVKRSRHKKQLAAYGGGYGGYGGGAPPNYQYPPPGGQYPPGGQQPPPGGPPPGGQQPPPGSWPQTSQG